MCQEETEISTDKHQTQETKVQTPNSSLPTTLTSTLLSKWRIPEEYWQDLQKVYTEDDLLNLPIPHKFIERILDNLFPRPI